MVRTITLTDVFQDETWNVLFDDKSFGPPSLEDLNTYSEDVLEQISGVLLRSLLFMYYMKNGNVNISATLDSDNPQGVWVKLNG
jgi:hypothetical protein